MFLGGSKSLLTIENPCASGNRELILFRDSFGSSLAPLLAEGYARVTLVDIRYISPALLSRYVDFHGKDVLFLYSTSVLNHSETINDHFGIRGIPGAFCICSKSACFLVR